MRKFTFLLTLLCLGGFLSAQTSPTQILDIRPGADNSSPNRFFEYNGRALFRANDGVTGNELWITDGTAAGTMLLKDINDDPSFRAGNSNPDQFIEYNGLVYFRAQSPGSGTELWVTDGTEAGTQQVAEIQPGDDNGNPFDFIVYRGLLYFTANDGTTGSELWSSDGTAAGTQLVVDIAPGSTSSNPNFKTFYRGALVFSADDGTNGVEPWISFDGTAAGTNLLLDINPMGRSTPRDFHVRGPNLFFSADDGTAGRELWVTTNGTAAGTFLLSDLNAGPGDSSPSQFFDVGPFLYYEADNGMTGPILREFDLAGGNIGGYLLSDVDQVTEIVEDSYYVLLATTSMGERDFFIVDGLGGTPQIFRGGADFGNLGDNSPRDLVWSGNSLYFTYEDDDDNRQLAGVDLFGNTGVTLFDPTDIILGDTEADDPFILNNQVIYEANDGSTGRELFSVTGQNAFVNLERLDGSDIGFLDSLEFGIVTEGFGSQQFVIFNNTGNAPATLVDFEFISDTDTLNVGSIGLSMGSLPAAPNNAVLVFQLDPATPVGDFRDTLIVEYTTNGGSEFEAFIIKGTVVAPSFDVDEAGVAVADGDQLDFLDVAVGGDSTRTITVNNTSQGTLIISDIMLADGTSFSVSPSDADTLAAGESLDLDVTFSNANAMDATDQLVITTNAGMQTINLNGTYLRLPMLRAEVDALGITSGDNLDFTDVPTFTDETQTITVTNDGLGDLVIDTAILATGFRFSVSEVTDDTLETDESINIDVTYSPESVGTLTDVLTLTTNTGDFVVNLNGMSILGSLTEQGIAAKAAFPNPTAGSVTLELEEPLQDAEWTVTDANGRVLRSGVWPSQVTLHTIGLEGLPSGVYQVIVAEGGKRVTARVMKR